MRYKTLGHSLSVSMIGLGGHIFGDLCGAREAIELFRRARDLGVNFVDTADVYAEGRSEECIGKAVESERDRWVIASKVGVMPGESGAGRGARASMIAKCEGSLRRLRTDCIDIYQMHHFDPDTPLAETWGAAVELQQAGKIRYFGVSNFSAVQLEAAVEAARSSAGCSLAALQSPYNLLKRSIEERILEVCRCRDVQIIVYGVLARGILSGKYQSLTELPSGSRAMISRSISKDITAEIISVVQQLQTFAQERGRTVSQLAIAWALRHPEILTVIVGVRSVQQLLDNVGAITWRLSPADLAEIDCIVGDSQRYQAYCLGDFS